MRIVILFLLIFCFRIGYKSPDTIKPFASVPLLEKGVPQPGKRVAVTEPEYMNTRVHHSLYLPVNYNELTKCPIIVEFTGNYYPESGSTGEVEGANLGYSLTLGKDFIWVVLPFIATTHLANEKTWWGDIEVTCKYARSCISRIIKSYKGDSATVILCGFSRGAIAVSYVGLHDDETAKLWSAFFTSDHFDGEREWSSWGTPLSKYRAEAKVRLQRINGRPFRICQDVGLNNGTSEIESMLRKMGLSGLSNITFRSIPMDHDFPLIPNSWFINRHTDLWPLFNSQSGTDAREWIGSLKKVDDK
jgi:hypothetical protein